MSPCRELKIANKYLNAIVSRLKTSKPNTHVSPSIGSSIAEPLRPSFAFLNLVQIVALVVVPLPCVLVEVTSQMDKVFLKARIKMTKLT